MCVYAVLCMGGFGSTVAAHCTLLVEPYKHGTCEEKHVFLSSGDSWRNPASCPAVPLQALNPLSPAAATLTTLPDLQLCKKTEEI